MKKLLLFWCIFLCSMGLLAEDQKLAVVDFSLPAWSSYDSENPITTSSKSNTTVNGISFKGFKENGFYIDNGEICFPNNNVNNSNYLFAIPVSNVNGKVKVVVTDKYTTKKSSWNICVKEETSPSFSSVTPTTCQQANSSDVTVTYEFSMQGSGTDAVIYIGRYSSNYKKLSKVEIYTQPVSVTINPIGNASFSSVCPIDFTGVEGIKAYMVTEETAESVTLTQINKVPANTGIFVIGTAGTYNIPAFDGTGAEPTTNNKLVATTAPKTVDGSENIWALSKTDGLLHPVTSGTIAAGKAYLVSTVGSGSAKAIKFDNGDTATGISTITAAKNVVEGKFIENGRIVIVKNGKKYNVAGMQK